MISIRYITILGSLALLLLLSCQNEARRYPSAEVSVGNHYEYTDAAGAKQLAVTLVVHNTSF